MATVASRRSKSATAAGAHSSIASRSSPGTPGCSGQAEQQQPLPQALPPPSIFETEPLDDELIMSLTNHCADRALQSGGAALSALDDANITTSSPGAACSGQPDADWLNSSQDFSGMAAALMGGALDGKASKEIERRIKNREVAAASRKRKRDLLQSMSGEKEALLKENEALKCENRMLRVELDVTAKMLDRALGVANGGAPGAATAQPMSPPGMSAGRTQSSQLPDR